MVDSNACWIWFVWQYLVMLQIQFGDRIFSAGGCRLRPLFRLIQRQIERNRKEYQWKKEQKWWKVLLTSSISVSLLFRLTSASILCSIDALIVESHSSIGVYNICRKSLLNFCKNVVSSRWTCDLQHRLSNSFVALICLYKLKIRSRVD